MLLNSASFWELIPRPILYNRRNNTEVNPPPAGFYENRLLFYLKFSKLQGVQNMEAITHPSEITAEWLTSVLHANGYLAGAEVVQVAQARPIITLLNYLVPLQASFTAGAALDVPGQLLLKFNRPDPELGIPAVGAREVAFYREIAGRMAESPAPRCFDSAYNEATYQSYLLLEDLSATHVAHSFTQIPPTTGDTYQIVKAVAQYQAFWWDHPTLGHEIGELPAGMTISAYCGWAGNTYLEFASFLGERLSRDRRKLYGEVLNKLEPALRQRLLPGRNLTLFHGDSHIGNYLTPVEPSSHKTRIIDWDGWGIELGVNDLVSLMGLLWFPDRRKQLEGPILEYYHSQLMAQGVSTVYSLENCRDDYRLMILKALFYPMAHWKMKLPSDIWWNHLERIIQAAQDLDCLEVLG
jgi:hypothetical protein